MSSRMFQSIILQMKDATDRIIGVIDADGTVVASSELTIIGEEWRDLLETLNAAGEGPVTAGGKTFRILAGADSRFDCAVFVMGEDEQARCICSLAAVALNGSKAYYEEKHDRNTFIKNIISDNVLLGDIYVRAKELHFPTDDTQAVFLIRQEQDPNIAAVDVLQALFPNRQTDFVISVSETDVVVVKQMLSGSEARDLHKVAKLIEETLSAELQLHPVIGIGTVATHLRDLAKSYKEAQIAIEVGKVFDTASSIINYENLGIGRLIYQLPTTLCAMFLQEVFKKNPIDALDQEILFTINKFFENNLNVSETARKLFVHRNTLVYRLEKIKKLTGLDLREFDDAITFKVALMVKKYLTSRGIEA